jgi:tetratricopeptide (TPR) repeat protein
MSGSGFRILLFLFVSAGISYPQVMPTAEEYLTRGDAQLEENGLDGAIRTYKSEGRSCGRECIHKARHGSNRGYIEMGRLHIELTIADFTKAIQLHADVIPYYRRGHARLIDEDLKGAISDFNQALSLKSQHEFLSWMIYANRGYAFLLQGKQKEAQSDSDRCPKPNNGHRILFQLHLRTLEEHIRGRRRLRVDSQKRVAKNEPGRNHLGYRTRRIAAEAPSPQLA